MIQWDPDHDCLVVGGTVELEMELPPPMLSLSLVTSSFPTTPYEKKTR